MEVATGIKPDFSKVFRCGSLCRVLKPLEKRTHKFDAHAHDCVYLGPRPLGGGARYLPLDTRRVLVRRDVVVYGDVMPFRTTIRREMYRYNRLAHHRKMWQKIWHGGSLTAQQWRGMELMDLH